MHMPKRPGNPPQMYQAAQQAQQEAAAAQAAKAASNQAAYNQLSQLGITGMFSSYNPNQDYTSMVPGLTGSNAISASDVSLLAGWLPGYTKGTPYVNDPGLEHTLASVLADPQKRSVLLQEIQYYTDTGTTPPFGTVTGAYAPWYGVSDYGPEKMTSALASMIGTPESPGGITGTIQGAYTQSQFGLPWLIPEVYQQAPRPNYGSPTNNPNTDRENARVDTSGPSPISGLTQAQYNFLSPDERNYLRFQMDLSNNPDSTLRSYMQNLERMDHGLNPGYSSLSWRGEEIG